jgi:N-acyl-D-aspartate/D-glutamate deacylase
MGKCGVGFAPARPDKHEWRIGFMEGVEDIPGTALAEGRDWNWETFPEYLDALEKLPRIVDVGTPVPHGSVCAYVLDDRERSGATPTEEDIAQMSAIVEDGVRAGALGRETGLPCTYAALQSIAKEMSLDEQIESMRAENDNGANIVAQIALRGNGIVMAWQGSVHPFRSRPSWQAIEELPWEEQKAKLLDPDFKAQLLSEENDLSEANQDIIRLIMVVSQGWPMQFEMGPDFNYEPTSEESVAARAEKAGKSGEEYAYDLLCRDDGKGFIYLPILN